jgi:hypothetical protein
MPLVHKPEPPPSDLVQRAEAISCLLQISL